MKIKFQFFIMIIFSFMVIGCNTADDLEEIFNDKVWKLTYITKENGHAWVKFSDVNEENYKQYDPINGTKKFLITFQGTSTNNAITGTLKGEGSLNIKGTWNANGESHNMSTYISHSEIKDNNDRLARHILSGIKEIKTYEGDSSNLYLYYQPKELEVKLCLVFKPLKK